VIVPPYLEVVSADGAPLAYIVGADWMPSVTTFLTPETLPLQMGMIVYNKNEAITPHVHLPITRSVEGTSECIVVRSGRCLIDIFDSNKRFVSTHELKAGAIILLLGGGHGFRMLEDTVLFEVKQGPYAGEADKARF
jgi:cupin fold WbuC family metalloprotein